jgi:acyl carrier protein
MNQQQIEDLILRILGQIAPEAELQDIRPEVRFRDQFEFDSVDFLNFALTLQEELRLHIPEEDFPLLGTLGGCLRYLLSRGSLDDLLRSS